MLTLLLLLVTTNAPGATPVTEHVARLTDSAMNADSLAAQQLTMLPFAREIDSASRRYRIPSSLIAAIVQEESRWQPWAARTEPHYKRKRTVIRGSREWSARHGGLPTPATELDDRSRSMGLMQVMGQVAREQGFAERYLSTLFQPAHAIDQGGRLLSRLFAKYPHDTLAVISAYNQGSPRKVKNTFVNARYVYRVVVAWRAYERYSLPQHDLLSNPSTR